MYTDNPDVKELLKYNELAKQESCEHINLRRIEGERGDGMFYDFTICKDCGVRNPQSKRQPNGCICHWRAGKLERRPYSRPGCNIHGSEY